MHMHSAWTNTACRSTDLDALLSQESARQSAALAAAQPGHDSDTDTDSESDISDNEAMWYAMLLDNKLSPS
jgi:hypothetical protein